LPDSPHGERTLFTGLKLNPFRCMLAQ